MAKKTSGNIQKKKRFYKKKSFWVRHTTTNPLSFTYNILLGGAIGLFFVFYDSSVRDYLTKNYALPILEEFEVPHIRYDTLRVQDQKTVKGSDISVYDDAKEKFLSIQDITIEPKALLDIEQGVSNLTISKMTLYKSPVFKESKEVETDDRIVIPQVPFDIENIKINKLILKPAITGLDKDLNLKIWARALKDNTANIKITSLDNGASASFDIKNQNNKLILSSILESPSKFVNDLIDNTYFQGKITGKLKGDVDLSSGDRIKINISEYQISDDKLNLDGQFSTNLLVEQEALQDINLALRSGNHTLGYKGSASAKGLDGVVTANQFNLTDLYPIDKDLKSLIVDGKIKLKGSYTQIPVSQGKIKITANYQDTPLLADIKGDYNGKESHLTFLVDNQKQQIAKGAVFSNIAQQTGVIDLVASPENLPNKIKRLIDVTAKPINFKSNFGYKNNKLSLSNAELTGQKLVLDGTPLSFEDMHLYFDLKDDKITLKPSKLITNINRQAFDTNISGTTYDFYKPSNVQLALKKDNSVITGEVKHKAGNDYFDVNIENLNLKNFVTNSLPISISKINTQAKGKMRIFSDDPLGTIDGTVKTSLFEDKAQLNLDGTIKKGNINADYSFLVNDTQTGKGTIQTQHFFDKVTSKGNIDLSALTEFIKNTEHRLTGILETDIIRKNDQLSGTFTLADGTYHNLIYNTQIENININGLLSDKAITINKLSANSKPSGSISGSGKISLDPTVESDLLLETQGFVPIQNEMVSVNTDSKITLIGTSKALTLGGNVTLNDLIIELPDLEQNYTPKVNIAEPEMTTLQEDTESTLLERITSDITVKIATGSKIYGYGLKGFPEGELHIVNTLDDPKVNGQIDIAKGTIEILGRDFTIDEGGIFLKNTNPIMNVEASHNMDDYKILLNLKGAVENPSIVFSSIPAVPKDEVIALLVFGKNKNELSPFQALRLANAIYQISRGKNNTGGTFDVLGNTERFLDLDNFNVESDNTIGAGKYLSEDLYVGTDYNPTTSESNFLLELRLSDTIKLKGKLNNGVNSINNINNSEIMIRKVKDY